MPRRLPALPRDDAGCGVVIVPTHPPDYSKALKNKQELKAFELLIGAESRRRSKPLGVGASDQPGRRTSC
jgi:hypothetical protein